MIPNGEQHEIAENEAGLSFSKENTKCMICCGVENKINGLLYEIHDSGWEAPQNR